MSILVAVTDSTEGRAALAAAADEAAALAVPLVAVNLTSAPLDLPTAADGASYEEVVPTPQDQLDEVDQVLREITARPDVTRLVVGVRQRSAVGKAILGSLPQRLILEATVPVLSVRALDT